uniref:UBP1-associated protein 2B n=1 Tax=Noccaea caerulescens TaxID=107243 RepID=A0A1J3K991_NOCCA
MAIKRKLESESNETSEPPQKQQQCKEDDPGIRNDDNQIHGDDKIECGGVEEVKGDDENNTAGDQTEAATSSGSGNRGGEDDDNEPIGDLLEPFSKDQLLILLKEAAERHCDVADRIRMVADEDSVHRKIFVHGLGWDTKADALIEAFKQYGEIEDCKLVVDKVSGQSKGYGFILFKSRSGARKALKQPQKKIGTRMTACQLASIGPVQGNPVAAPNQQHFNPEHVQRKIYVSNVSADIDPQKLLAFFSRFGEVEEGPLGLDKATGRPKGFALFVYRSPESAKKALEEPHKTFEGHVLHCHKANDGPKPVKQHHQNSHNQNSRYQRNEVTGYGAPGGHGNFIAGNNQAAQGLNPAIGHALTAFLASQGAGLGMNQAFGQALLGTASPGNAAGMPSGYGAQANITPGVFPGYVFQAGFQGGYQTQQPGQGGAGRGQHGVGYGGPYMGQ